MQAKQQHGHDQGKGHTRRLGFKARQTCPFPGPEGYNQANEQREAGPLKQEKTAQGDRQQDKSSNDSLFKH